MLAHKETGLHDHAHLLVACSGGSDSMALLHALRGLCPTTMQLSVATVDHGLRPEAATEARIVAGHCADLSLSHTTLQWNRRKTTDRSDGIPAGPATPAGARMARYALLADHARRIGASAIALGHTLDDQVETLVMRAARAKPHSRTRGMSGMPFVASYEEIKLLRPLLRTTRNTLRAYLRDQGVSWIDDPSNENMDSERVRVRQRLSLESDKAGSPLLSAEAIGRFAELSGRSRAWLGAQVAHVFNRQLHLQQGRFLLNLSSPSAAPLPATVLPPTILEEALSTLILVTGGQTFRPAAAKIADLVAAATDRKPLRKAVGRCLVTVHEHHISIRPEDRSPAAKRRSRNSLCEAQPELRMPLALRRFRPASDDAIHAALASLLSTERPGTAGTHTRNGPNRPTIDPDHAISSPFGE